MGSAPDPPPAPDPVKTANAQANENVASAIGTQEINMVNQNTPNGNLNYNQTGNNTYTMKDANGKVQTYTIPQFTATQTYSPQQQALYDLNNKTQQTIGQIGVDQSAKMGALLNTPIDLSDTSIDDDLYKLYSPRITQQQNNQNNSMQSTLAAQGVTPGTPAYAQAMQQMSQANNDQWNQMYLNGHNSAIQQMTMQRQEPINELNALMAGSQVSNPTFGQTPSTNIAPPNYEQDVQNSFQDQMAGYNAQLQSSNATMGGIAGLGGSLISTALGGWMRSDRRLKSNIRKLAVLDNGLPIYLYDIGGKREVGLIAQDVAAVKPWAVMEINHVLHVNYEEAI